MLPSEDSHGWPTSALKSKTSVAFVACPSIGFGSCRRFNARSTRQSKNTHLVRRSKRIPNRQPIWPSMSGDEEVAQYTARPVTSSVPGLIRPKHVTNFSIPYQDLVIREWKKNDRMACVQLIGSVLSEYGLEWDPITADRDVVEVEEAYKKGEFWVVEDITTAAVVGTGAYYEVPHRGDSVVEIRKMYLHKSVRGLGLGSFLLCALEQRALQLGYSSVIVETASVLKEACALYDCRGYKASTGLETKRCDLVLEKSLHLPDSNLSHDLLEVIDMTQGWTVTYASKEVVNRNRLLFRAVAVLVETGNKIVVHRRSYKKASFPGKMAALVTGCIDWNEDPLTAAKREVMEEVGLSNLDFRIPFAPFVADGEGTGYRIQFHPFIASGDFAENQLVCDPTEVDSAELMTREQIIEAGIGGSLWQEFRSHGL